MDTQSAKEFFNTKREEAFKNDKKVNTLSHILDMLLSMSGCKVDDLETIHQLVHIAFKSGFNAGGEAVLEHIELLKAEHQASTTAAQLSNKQVN